MRNYIRNSVLCLLIGLMCGCEDFLDKKESQSLTEEQVFGDPDQFKKFCDEIYTYEHYTAGSWASTAFGGLGRIAYSSFEGATDLAEASRDVSGTNAGFNLGNWAVSTPGVDVELVWPWDGAYKGIRICNVVLERIDGVPGLKDNERKNLRGEALFFRAFYHFELIKRYGGVPYVTRSFKEDENLDLEREPFDVCVEKICKDLDDAFLLLNDEVESDEYGRPCKWAALALKAKALIYDASPLNTEEYTVTEGGHNWDNYFIETPNTPEEIQSKWINAAKTCYQLISSNKYQLLPNSKYSSIFHTDPQPAEVIFSRIDGPWSFTGPGKVWTGWIVFNDYGASIGYGGKAGTYPTQNLIDMYEMADGTIPILGYENGDGTKPIINPNANYNDQQMWENRDPRLKLTVLCNQDMWQKRPVEIWFDKKNPVISGSEMKDSKDYTTTGYLCKKMWPEKLTVSEPDQSVIMNWIWIRYTDVLLWYAEAMNQAFGPNIDGLGNGKTALDALNDVRMRIRKEADKEKAKLNSSISKEQFQERLMNERAIEFVYEEQRWWDVIRYKKGDDVFNKPIYGVRPYRLSKSPLAFELTRVRLEKRTFYDFMHKYPIPFKELEKSSKLKQNPGW